MVSRALSVLVIAGFPAPSYAYYLLTCGSCETHVMSLSDCSAGALALGLSDTTAEDDGQTGVTYDPPYCYFEYGRVKFNANGANTGDCTTTDQCICSGTQGPSAPPPPVPPVAPVGGVFTITSGFDACEYTSNGTGTSYPGSFDCITDGSGNYGNHERCTVRVNTDAVITPMQYDIEDNMDYLTINTAGSPATEFKTR